MMQPSNLPISEGSELLGRHGFLHGFSTRVVDLRPSSPTYAADLERLREAVGLDSPLIQVSQVHGNVVRDAKTVYSSAEEADALVGRSGLALGVRVADCVPLLLADRRTRTVAAVHAGWKGLVAGVIENAFRAMNAKPEETLAAIGPSIGACCFEVGDDVAEQIREAAQGDVIRTGAGKPHADLRAASRNILVRLGLSGDQIADVGSCTMCTPDRYFSYRREAEKSGRMLAFIEG